MQQALLDIGHDAVSFDRYPQLASAESKLPNLPSKQLKSWPSTTSVSAACSGCLFREGLTRRGVLSSDASAADTNCILIKDAAAVTSAAAAASRISSARQDSSFRTACVWLVDVGGVAQGDRELQEQQGHADGAARHGAWRHLLLPLPGARARLQRADARLPRVQKRTRGNMPPKGGQPN